MIFDKLQLEMLWNFENIVMIAFKPLQINQMSALNNL